MSERILTEHSSVHDVGIAETDLDGMHRVCDFLDEERNYRVDKHDVSVLMQGHLESERTGFWPILQHYFLPLDRKRCTCRTNQKRDNNLTLRYMHDSEYFIPCFFATGCLTRCIIIGKSSRRFILPLSSSALLIDANVCDTINPVRRKDSEN